MTDSPLPAIRGGSGESLAGRLRRPGSFTVCLALRPHYEVQPSPPEALRLRLAGCAAEGLVQGFFVSDGLPGSAGLSAETIASWVLEHGGEPVMSLSLAARDRVEALALAQSWRRMGVNNILLVSGDYPAASRERNLFDIDSVQALMLLREAAARRDGFPAELHKGCVVTPFKRLESELMWQYARLRRKVDLGADFIVSQAGFDPRAWDELLRFCRLERLERPVIGTVLVPGAELARRIGAGKVPGVSIPPRLLERFASPEADAGLRLAGAAVAVLRGLGYQGVLIGGRPLAPDEVRFILEEAARLAPRWEECLGEFREPLPRFGYFHRDEKTGLNEDRLAEVPGRSWHRPMYGFSYAIDHVLFGPVEPVFRLLTRTCRFCDARPFWKQALFILEWLSKAPLYHCRMCGDCTLYACGFYCSESGCPKRMVNGPCGGSLDGGCEVPSAGICLWVKVYDRLKSRVARPTFTAPPIPPKDRRLAGSCSWINFCLGRDHRKLSGKPSPKTGTYIG
jgi:methylenetetrahydrofolate reductase (NADPH)